ncbi:MAG: histidinol dehydrogenase [Acidobacteria bacterium]|nr:histidinol dehydrogenase [Acidobacteriota bacterium]
MIKIVHSTNRAEVEALLKPSVIRDQATEKKAATIVEHVRNGGDEALKAYAKALDGWGGPLEVPRKQIEAGAKKAPKAIRAALARAADAIRDVASAQRPKEWRIRVAPGVSVEQRVIPLERVGCYVPGGRYPLPSSLLMTAIPARVAGVPEVIVCSPSVDPVVLAAAVEAGADRVFRIGGAHAVAAMAYGTKSVPRVSKIVGPGNRWVSAAKAIVAQDCPIDFYAGPSEILIVADSGPADWIAADLIAQAEHDPDARAVFITAKLPLAREVAEEVARQLPATGPAATSLWNHGGIIVTKTMDEAVALANEAASEHLVVDTEARAGRIRNAGAIFIGPWTAQVAGDYAIGSNHTLPTAGVARVRGGLHTADFVKLVSVQRVTKAGLMAIGPTVTTLARAEGLEGHAQSIDVRLSTTTRKKTSRR